jgi:hypothetical protein
MELIIPVIDKNIKQKRTIESSLIRTDIFQRQPIHFR